MAMTVEVDEGAARWSEIVAGVEAGRDVVIARDAVPMARIRGEATPRQTTREAIEAIKEVRKGIPPTTAEAILAWRDEERRY